MDSICHSRQKGDYHNKLAAGFIISNITGTISVPHSEPFLMSFLVRNNLDICNSDDSVRPVLGARHFIMRGSAKNGW